MGEIVQEPLFDEPEDEADSFAPNIKMTGGFAPKITMQASVAPVQAGEVYAVELPTIFPSKFEEEYIADGLIRSMKEKGVNDLEIYIGFKQLESISKTAYALIKSRATKFAKEHSVTQVRGVKVSMRSFNSYWVYDDDVQSVINDLDKQIAKLEAQKEEVQKQAKAGGKATKMSGAGHGISIKFREM